MMTTALTSAALAAHDSAVAAVVEPAEDESAYLSGLIDAEASAARHEHVQALLREYEELLTLSPELASGWQQRRERTSTLRVQKAWRRRSVRRRHAFMMQHNELQRRTKAATTIQRVQRMRQRVVNEAAPAFSKEDIDRVQKEIVERTLAMAKEMRKARKARDEWRERKDGGPQPPLPRWSTTPDWLAELQNRPAFASPIAKELREDALRGVQMANDTKEIVRQLQSWPRLRGAIHANAVRHDIMRTQAAALYAQLSRPPQLPPPPKVRSMSPASADSIRGLDPSILPPIPPSKPHILKAHQRALKMAKVAVEEEERRKARESGVSNTAYAAAAAVRAAPVGSFAPNSTLVLECQEILAQTGQTLSAAEVLWLQSVEQYS
jgi:hypothetical protein